MEVEKKEKKIKIDLKNKRHQENIKNILENIIKSENTFNNYLNTKKEIYNSNYSPCYIISKIFLNEFKQLFNYDYFKKNEEFNLDLIINQRKNENIIYINNLKEITIKDLNDNNIVILNEITFISLYNVIPNLQNEKNKYIVSPIYLMQNKGILLLDKYLFIFETNDITEIKKYELINFISDENAFLEIKNQLDKNNITNDLWNKLIYDYCNNCEFIIIKDKDNIDKNITNLVNKINNYKLYFQNNPKKENEFFCQKLKGFQSALNLYEIYLKEKELYIKQLINNKNNNNNINNINNENYNNINHNEDSFNINTHNIIYNNTINNNNIIRNNNNENWIKIDRNKPSLGLGNIGSTCYMNATLQSLAHIPELADDLINIYYFNEKNNNIKLNKLTTEFMKLLINIYFPKRNKEFFAPYDIKKIIGAKEALFRGNEAEDAKDLYLFLIETMNYELNGERNQIYNDIVKLGIDLRDQFKIKQTFLNEFWNKNNNSPIAKYLYGFSITISECLKCRTKKYNYECFNFINFSLLDIKNYTKNKNYNYDDNYILNLEDCFLFNQKKELYNGNNKMICNYCNGFEDGQIQRVIDISPPILVIVLDRGIDNSLFKDNFNFDEFLDLSKFIMDKNSNTKYYLSGIITHIGESGRFGHFVAFNKMDINSPWYLYNDSNVSKVKDINDIFKVGKPYILFYHFINN